MYIKSIRIQNYGPIDNMRFLFSFDEEGKPYPTIVIGRNGTGKTLILANILHALIEIKRGYYRDLEDVSGDSYYRIESKSYIKNEKNDAYYNIQFNNADWTELMTRNYEIFKKNFSQECYPKVDIDNNELRKEGFFSKKTAPADNPFRNEICLYFPVDRYYIPTWTNKTNEQLKFVADDKNIVGKDNYGIVQYNILEGLETWIMDVIIDMYLYEGSMQIIRNEDTIGAEQVFHGRNHDIQKAINNILTTIYTDSGFSKVRFGISKKRNRSIEVIGIKENGLEVSIVPRFSSLSYGEMMILGIFSTIIKAYDQLGEQDEFKLENIKGIVLIDEIDVHLHSDQLRRGLPELIATFPGVQFIMSSHSPFFLLGMKEQFNNKCIFLAMPAGITLDRIENFEEIQKSYSIVDDSYNSAIESYQLVIKKMKTRIKPLIITEGKTDWKHLKHALNKLKLSQQFLELDITFQEYEYDFCDSKLETLLKNVSQLPNAYPVIGVFDSDSPTGIKYKEIVEFGNNVYGCCIMDTMGYDCGISIELLYSRKDLTITDEQGRRIYLSDEFTNKSMQLKSDNRIVCHNSTLIDAQKRNIIKVVDSDVFDSNERSLALSKNKFADYILSEEGKYKNVSVEGFSDIFCKIESIVNKFKQLEYENN